MAYYKLVFTIPFLLIKILDCFPSNQLFTIHVILRKNSRSIDKFNEIRDGNAIGQTGENNKEIQNELFDAFVGTGFLVHLILRHVTTSFWDLLKIPSTKHHLQSHRT